MGVLRHLVDNWDAIGPEAITHIRIVALVIVLASALGIPLGVLAARRERLGNAALAIASVILTIPSFALFVVLRQALVLFGDPPVVAGLTLYALLPLMRSTRSGLRAVDPAIVEAARGMGMSRAQILARVEMPLALPLMLAGLRQATVMVVAIATVGAVVGSNNLGQTILEGISAGNRDIIMSGILPVAAIALSADLLLALLQKVLSRGASVGATT